MINDHEDHYDHEDHDDDDHDHAGVDNDGAGCTENEVGEL